MDEKIVEIAFGIITYSGEARFMAKDALNQAKEGKFGEAKQLLINANETLVNAHKFQTDLITKEANGEKTELNIVLIHSQDHLMNTMNYIELVEELIEMYKVIKN